MVQEGTQITAESVTPTLRALFRTDEPQARRYFAVLDELTPQAKILTDDPAHPAWDAVWESCDGTTFQGGHLAPAVAAHIFAELRQEGDVLIGLWPGDPHQNLLSPAPDYDARTLEFYDRPLGQGLDRYLHHVPEGCAIRRLA